MGHIVNNKKLYQKLGQKLDGLTLRVPYNQACYQMLKELYLEDEAQLAVQMPYGFSNIDRLKKITNWSVDKLRSHVKLMADKGLLFDIWNEKQNEYNYAPSPLVIGIFEFSMMRTDGKSNPKLWAKLFSDYMNDPAFFAFNKEKGQQVGLMKTIPHNGIPLLDDYVEIFDYQKAYSFIESHNKMAIGLCSCRHEKLHLNEKKCNTPLDTCCTFGLSADYAIRHNLAKEVSKKEMLASIDRAYDLKLVLNADNVKTNNSFICQCCSCCCNIFKGINKYGYENILVTSGLVACLDTTSKCTLCTKCVKICPVSAITFDKKVKRIEIQEKSCLGCSLCTLVCENKSLKMKRSDKRVILPQDAFEKFLLNALEMDNLHNFIFDIPNSRFHQLMRFFLGNFLRLNGVKKMLLSEKLRSRFLNFIKEQALKKGISI